ncbi:hypothetical protein [Pedobacter sp. MC2016-24]|uniref:hypothetical protein n=1 Tax=Pedobacter sp. MC2016-24 TaxID=2780090 RepID=UPI001880D42E|nr:hypothetical protein [Pedobacter sp. MC2016-24]MBE9602009.1 hypothetical protein [Pedobacter sp. MC2016-24]
MYKVLFILSCALLVTGQLQAQSKKPVKAPLPPPRIKVPPPPPIMPSWSELQELEENPLEKLYVAFKTDPVYLKTDSAFIVQEIYFNPGGYGGGRININNAMYPANYTQDSLKAKEGYVVMARLIETEYRDGKYHYDGKYPKKSKKIIFIDDKDKKETIFTIVWNTNKAEAKKTPIKSLVEDKTKRLWKVTEPLPISPTM